MTRPHERLNIPQPIGRRLPRGLVGWNFLIMAVIAVMMVGYVVQVNRASARGFALRDVQTKVDALNTDVVSLEDKVATLSSVQSLTDRATALGFVPVDRLEFVNPASKSYAMAK